MKDYDFITKSFYTKLNNERINESNEFEQDITAEYYLILEILSQDFDNYRKYSPRILSALENNKTKGISYSISVFFNLYKQVLQKDIVKLDTSVANTTITEETKENFFQSLKEIFEAGTKQKIRISDFNLPLDKLSKEEKNEIISLIIGIIQEVSKKINWNGDESETVMMQLPFLRSLLIQTDNEELFYYVIGIFIDRLNSSEYHQAARDFVEEILKASFNDEISEFGFFNSFRCYSSQGSAHTAILFANVSLYIANKKGSITNKYLQEIIWQVIKYFREIKFSKFAVHVYESIPSNLFNSSYERRSIDHTYFTALLRLQNEELPRMILDYLNKEREEIIQGGVLDCTPWLITLYNIRRIFPKGDYSPTGLGFYINVFESIVPNEVSNKYKSIIEGNAEFLKDELKKSLIKLEATRYTSDIIYDTNPAIKISNRLIEQSFENEDFEAILLAMIIKSDFSLSFVQKESEEITPFKIPSDQLDEFDKIYGNIKELNKELDTFDLQTFIWLPVTEGKVFQLTYSDKKFTYTALDKWNWSNYQKLLQKGFFSSLSFDETTRDSSGAIRELFEEDYFESSKEIKDELSICEINTKDFGDRIFIIKDMELAEFPHNLFLDDKIL